MNDVDPAAGGAAARPHRGGWTELWLKEDWWAVWLGIGIVLVAYGFFAAGATIKPIAVAPAKWHTFGQLWADFTAHVDGYGLQFLMWVAIFGVSLRVMGHKFSEFLPAFVFIYILSIIIFMIGAWDQAHHYNLEPPLVALVVGMVVSNFIGLPRWMDTGFRVEYYIKTGIVLLGATLPFTLIIWAGPYAIVQASVISITTFVVIYFAATRLGLDRRLAACLGAGGAVCGVSGAIAIAGAVGAKKEHPSIAITMVIVWAILMIFFLPLVSRALHLHTGVAGAWIGTSEFADAAGFAAAQAYGSMAAGLGLPGTPDQAVWGFTLMKVIGRDIWIGLWAFILAIIATTRWEAQETGVKPDAAQIWWRFPKFVVGFLAASVLMTVVVRHYSLAEFNRVAKPLLVGPVKALRTWSFIFCFLSIGLTTRFRELASVGAKPFWAFSVGAIVNVLLGFLLSAVIFGTYWSNLGLPK